MSFDEHTFDNFIVGESNKFTYDAVLAVAEGRNKPHYNPFYIYGESGLGKTHLLRAVRHLVEEKYPDRKVIYIRCDDFIDELVLSIRDEKRNEFRDKYSTCDILLVDDTQNLAGKSATQQELIYIYNTLREKGTQIIVTSDKPVVEMNQVVDTLRTRLISGLNIQIQLPEKALRVAIIKQVAKNFEVVLPDDIVNCIAENVDSNIRHLEGITKTTIAYRSSMDKEINIEHM